MHKEKWQLALEELDRVTAAGAGFDLVLAEAAYGTRAAFRQGLSARGLTWAVGILPTQKVYPADVRLAAPPKPPTGRPQQHPVPSALSQPAERVIAALGPTAFRRLAWRRGTKGPLVAEFAACRVTVADGPLMARAQHRPGEAAWLVCERRASGEVNYYLTNHRPTATLGELARALKARWVSRAGAPADEAGTRARSSSDYSMFSSPSASANCGRAFNVCRRTWPDVTYPRQGWPSTRWSRP